MKTINTNSKGSIISDNDLKIMLAEVNLKTANLNAYFSHLQSRIDAVMHNHNETADPSLITPTRTTLSVGSALTIPLITREEIEDFKRKELAKLGLDYIPQVLAGKPTHHAILKTQRRKLRSWAMKGVY